VRVYKIRTLLLCKKPLQVDTEFWKRMEAILQFMYCK
jgi:hypothetical protein